MTYILDLDAYELHLRDEKPSMISWWMLRFCILQMIKVDWYSKVYLYTYVNYYKSMSFLYIFYVHIVTRIFIVGILHILHDFSKRKLV